MDVVLEQVITSWNEILRAGQAVRGRATDRRSGQRLPGFSSKIGIGSGHQVERVGHALNERTALLRGDSP